MKCIKETELYKIKKKQVLLLNRNKVLIHTYLFTYKSSIANISGNMGMCHMVIAKCEHQLKLIQLSPFLHSIIIKI